MSFISVIAILLVSKLTIFLFDIIEKICSFVVKMIFPEKVRTGWTRNVDRKWTESVLEVKYILVCIVRQGRAKVFRKIQNKDFIVAGTLEAGGGFGFNHDR